MSFSSFAVGRCRPRKVLSPRVLNSGLLVEPQVLVPVASAEALVSRMGPVGTGVGFHSRNPGDRAPGVFAAPNQAGWPSVNCTVLPA